MTPEETAVIDAAIAWAGVVQQVEPAAAQWRLTRAVQHLTTSVNVLRRARHGLDDARTKELTARFWNLTSAQRREIVRRMSLELEDGTKLLEPERYSRALLRATELGVLDQLSFEIAACEETR